MFNNINIINTLKKHSCQRELFYQWLRYFSEKAVAPHSSTLAWKIPWMEEPGRLQSMRSRRVGHDSDFTFNFHFPFSCIGEGNGNPLQCSCLENPTDGGAWWAAVCGVAQSRTWLKWLSSSSSKILLDKQKEILATSRPCIEGNSKLL